MKHIRACISFILLLSTLLGLLAVPAWAAAPAPTETTGETANTTEATETTETTSATEATQAPETTEAATEATEATEVTEATEPAPADDHEEDPVYLDDSRSKSMGYGTAGYTLESMERVPLYLQTDYPTVPYSGGSVATSGCTIACVSMVASYFMGIEILPDNLAKRFNKYDASNLQRMEAASIVLDIPYKKTMDLQEAIDALADGKVAIILLGKSSPFTASQHTVVLAGITKDGKVLVNDPYGPNHAKAELRDGFANGFPLKCSKRASAARGSTPNTPPPPRASPGTRMWS